MEEILELRIARESVQDFHDEIMHQHAVAMSCCECEDWLNKGISAYGWLRQAEETIREGIARQFVPEESIPDFAEAVYSLYLTWLDPCQNVDKWVADLVANGYTPENLNEFRECREQVRTWIEENQWRQRGRHARAKLFAEEPF